MKNSNTADFREQGFTIIESLTAIVLICTCTVITGAFLNAALKTTGRIRDTLVSTADLLRADEELRRLAAAVTIPYWERRVNITQSPDRVVIPWYGGGEDGSLEFIKNGASFSLNITGGQNEASRVVRIPPVRSVIILRDEYGSPLGLDIAWEYRDEDIRTICFFSSSLPVSVKDRKGRL
jgi:type II secretory pathway pseudopilin PulG